MWIKHRCFSFFEKRFGWFLYHFVDRVRDRTRYTHRSREAQHHTDISTACHMHSNKMGILQCEGRFLGWNGFILEGREHSKWDHSIVSQVGHFLNILATFWYWMSPQSMYIGLTTICFYPIHPNDFGHQSCSDCILLSCLTSGEFWKEPNWVFNAIRLKYGTKGENLL